MKLNKIIDDTLKNPNGKWSRKSLTMLVSFIMCILIGTYIVISNYITETEINKYAIEVFYGFLLLSGGTSALTVYDKIKGKKKGNDDESDN